jgi:hypothetical protein
MAKTTKQLFTTDREILAMADSSVRPRMKMELQVVHLLMELAGRYGWKLVETSEAENSGDLLTDIMNLDEAVVDVFSATGNPIGWIKLVFGNNGYDCISDYTSNLESLLDPIDTLATQLEEGF